MARVIVADDSDVVAEAVISGLSECPGIDLCQRGPADSLDELTAKVNDRGIDTVIYGPRWRPGKCATPDLGRAEAFLRCCAQSKVGHVVLLASAAAYGCTHYNPGLISEMRPLRISSENPIAAAWIELERIARSCLSDDTTVTILRLAPMPVPGGADYFSRLFTRGLAVSSPGYDPSIQILSPFDLAGAACCAVQKRRGGVFNVAPDTVIPLSAALRLTGAVRIPVPRGVQRFVRGALAPAGLAQPISQVDYIRYSFAISNEKMKRDLGFMPARSSAEALVELMCEAPAGLDAGNIAGLAYDPFGMDKEYIAAYARTLFKFLDRYYWRIEVDGIENVPRQGRVMLVGVHRGFMPWDGVMALHLIVERIGRYPRFLTHPGLVKFPFLFDFVRRLGGVIACRENADYLLERDEMVGMFPEGVQGAFSLYRDAYRLGKFGRDEFVKMAIRNRTPMLPFVTVGSAEVFPILKKVEWNWWKRRMEWRCLPITPTFPLLPPLPLPSKWHTQFLPPIHIEERYSPEAAGDAKIVRAVSRDVRDRLQKAMDGMLARRKSYFHGSVFERDKT